MTSWRERQPDNAWQRKGKTYRAKSLEALKTLYSSGINATLEGQPDIDKELVKDERQGNIPQEG